MTTTYPGTIQLFTNPAGTTTLAAGNHSGLHSDMNDTVEAIETVIGTTAGTNVLKSFSAGDFPVRSNVGGTLQGTISGTLSNSLFSGTVNNSTLGTPSIVVGSDATGDMFYRSSGTVLARTAIGTPNQILTVSAATVPAWADPASPVGFAAGTQSGIATVTTTSYTDLANATIVTTAAGTLVANGAGRWSNTGAGQDTIVALVINSATVQSYSMRENTATHEKAYALTGMGTYAAGTQTIKVQGSRNGGTAIFDNGRLTLTYK